MLRRDCQLPRQYLSLRRDICKPLIAVSLFLFKVLVLLREVHLLERFFPLELCTLAISLARSEMFCQYLAAEPRMIPMITIAESSAM